MSDFDPRLSDPHEPHQLPAVPQQPTPGALGPPLPAAPWIDAPDKQQGGFNFMSFLHSLRRRWLLGLGLGCLLASTAAALLWALVPIKTEAILQLRVRRNNEQILRDKFSRPEHPQSYEIEKQTQMALIRSPFVINAALNLPGVSQLRLVQYKPWFGKRKNPIAWLERQVKVESAEGSELLQLSMKAPFSQREDLKTVLNKVKDAYMRDVVDAERKETRIKLDKLKNEQRDLNRGVREQLDRIAELARTYGSTESEAVQVQLELDFKTLAGLEREKSTTDRAYFEAYDSLLMHEQLMASNQSYQPREFEIDDMLMQYPEYATLKSQVIDLKSQMQFSSGRGPLSPGAGLQGQIAQLTQQMEQFKYEKHDEAIQRLRMLNNNDDRTLSREAELMKARLASIAKRRDSIYQRYDELHNRVRQMNAASSDLAVRQMTLKSNQELLTRVDEEIQTLGLEMDKRAQIEVLTKNAIIPDEAGNWIVKYMQIIATWIFGFLGTFLAVTLWDMQHQRVNSSQEVIDQAGDVRVIGSLPLLSSRRLAGLLPMSDGHRRMVEVTLTRAIDSIRTALLFARNERPYEVIMITSALGQEGKTTVASQLAVSFARSGRRTLLIDGDLRNPQQHVVLGMPMEKGLAELLRSECSLEDVLKPTPAEGLWALSTGFRDAYTDQNLAGPMVGKLFRALRAQFDMIVIDTGPTLTSPDSMLLGQHVDAAVISVRRDVSRLPKFNDAVERLRGVGVPIAGVVLNGAGVDIRESESKQIAPAANEPQLEQVEHPA